MQKRKKTNIAEDYARILSGKGHILEKQELVTRAILEDQLKFLKVCKEKWGDDFYSKIVADC
jgi:hypothetical protein